MVSRKLWPIVRADDRDRSEVSLNIVLLHVVVAVFSGNDTAIVARIIWLQIVAADTIVQSINL